MDIRDQMSYTAYKAVSHCSYINEDLQRHLSDRGFNKVKFVNPVTPEELAEMRDGFDE